jgi:hypothetical protein
MSYWSTGALQLQISNCKLQILNMMQYAICNIQFAISRRNVCVETPAALCYHVLLARDESKGAG